MAICKCSPEYSNTPHTDSKHEFHAPHKCLVIDCKCQGFKDHGSTWTDTFVKKSRENEF